MKFLIFIFLFVLVSCSSANKDPKKVLEQSNLKNDKDTFNYIDQNGQYKYFRQILVEERKKKVSGLVKIYEGNNDETKLLEKTVAVSEIGSIQKKKSKRNVLRPVVSQHTVWLEGKQHFSQLKVDLKSRSLKILLKSPEEKWNGEFEKKFPEKNVLYCFVTTLPECLKFSQLTTELMKKEGSKIKIYLIWEAYPFIMDMVDRLEENVFSPAYVYYEGLSDEGHHKFSVEFSSQIISYHFDKQLELNKVLWVSQGISIVK